MAEDDSDGSLASIREIRCMRDPVEIVRAAPRRSLTFKAAGETLEACEPSAAAARELIRQHDGRETDPWLVAYLLGANGHAEGYETVLKILRAAAGLSSESYAAHALVRIRNHDALRDLIDVLHTHEDARVRRACASALAELGSQPAIDALRAALRRGRVSANALAPILAAVPVSVEVLIDDLRSTDRETRRWPTLLVVARIRRAIDPRVQPELARCAASLELCEALRTAVDAPESIVFESEADALRAWLASLA